MRLTVTEVHQRSQGNVWATFSSPQGDGMVQWKADRYPAGKGRSYHVEFDILIPIETSMISRTIPPPNAGFIHFGEGTQVTGLIESMDEDGVGYLRISTDCLIMVETRLDAAAVGMTVSIRLNPDQLHATLYDVVGGRFGPPPSPPAGG